MQILRLMEAVRVQDQMLTEAANGGMKDMGEVISFDCVRGRVPGVLYGSDDGEEWSTHRKTEEVRWDEPAEACQAGTTGHARGARGHA